jgi:hypothetical protein
LFCGFEFANKAPYWLGRAQESKEMRDAAAGSYGDFLSLRAERGLLADDARRRMAPR